MAYFNLDQVLPMLAEKAERDVNFKAYLSAIKDDGKILQWKNFDGKQQSLSLSLI